MDSRIEFLCQQSEQVFGKRSALLTLWQTIADNFYVERADFTVMRTLGQEFSDHLMSSYPVLARRDLGNSIGAMLRPTSKEWKYMRTKENYDRLGNEARAWLEWADKRMSRAMSRPSSMFNRATKEGDHDFASFGQAALQVTLNREANGLLYRCWHLRDVAWVENENGVADTVYRRWKPTAQQLTRIFGDKVHANVREKLEKTPYCEFNVLHAILPADYMPKDANEIGSGLPYRSVYIDIDNKHIMEDIGLFEQEYLIPRWQTVSGSQYAYSPATVVALPDARLLQAMTLTLLEAGEKAVSPPLLAVEDAIRSDVSLFAGGITWVDREYDERLGEVLRPITQDKSGIPLGIDMSRDSRMMIAEAFFLNKLNLPQPEANMTAYEVGQRVQEFIRQAMPLFEPIETEYNGPLCELTFAKMMRAGAFGSPMDMPKELQGEEIEFMFESPLHEATERAKGQRFLETKSMLAEAAQLDPTAVQMIDVNKALRDVLQAIGAPANWTRSEQEVAEIQAAEAERQEMEQAMQAMQQGADITETLLKTQGGVPAQEPIV